MNRGPDIKQATGNHVAFQFPKDIDARITIEIKEVHTRLGKIDSHIIYSSEEDKEYQKLVGLMTRAAGSIIEYNFSDGKKEWETPDDLSQQLETFKTFIRSFYKEKGYTITSRLLGGAKAEIFQKESKIRERTTAEKQTLGEILRWHIEQAINSSDVHPITG